MTKLELTDEEAESFKAWRKHQNVFETLHNAGIFDIRGACVEICFNMDGIMTTIRGEIYRRKSKEE